MNRLAPQGQQGVGDRLVQPTQPEKTGFLQRLKLSFGGPQAKEQIKAIEESQGTRGKLDIGDIADVAGATLPVVGGVLGAIPAAASTFGLGTAGGAAAGSAVGQGVRRFIGGMIGADQPTVGEIAKDVALTGVGTYVGGRVLTPLFNALSKVIPQKLISTIFKQSSDDIAREVKSGGTNLTQSQEILNEGFRGSPKKMMSYAWETMKTLEQQAQGTVKNVPIKISNKSGYINLISDYVNNTKKTSFGFDNEIAKEGNKIVTTLAKTKGNVIPGEIALSVRRFIDGVRRTSSFRSNPNLSPKESAYKKAADLMRRQLSDQVPGLSDVMKKYTIHINAFDDLANYAAKTQNKDLFDLIDVFIMYGIDPSAYLARRGLTSATFKTNVAQGLYKAGKVVEKVIPKGFVPQVGGVGARRLFGQ